MLNKLRSTVNDNKIYSWMVIFIIVCQAYALFFSGTYRSSLAARQPSLSREEFKEQIEKRQQAIQDLVKEDPGLATNLGYISLFMLLALMVGCVFLADYLIQKNKYAVERIPQTLEIVTHRWGLDDVVKVVILFVFFNHFFSLLVILGTRLFSLGEIDRRTNIVTTTGLMDILVLLLVLRFVMIRHREGLITLGLSMKNILKNIGVAVYSYIGFLPILAICFFSVVAIARALNYTPPPEPIYELIFEERRSFHLIIISILISLGGPVIEEVFFRGFLYGAIKKRYNVKLAIFLSALFFSFLHTNLLGFIPILTLGIFLAYIREKSGSLIPPITVHIMHNSVLACLMFLVRYLTA